VKQRLMAAVTALHDSIAAKSDEWADVVKVGRTHMQDATPITLGQEWSGYAGMLADNLERLDDALKGVYRLALGGTAVVQVSTRRPDLQKRLRRKSRRSQIYRLLRRQTSLQSREPTTHWYSFLARCEHWPYRSTR
jgi:fumarate hydratase class II